MHALVTSHYHEKITKFMTNLCNKCPNEPEFIQAVEDVVRSVYPIIKENKKYQEHKILDRITVPDRTVSFRVDWIDNKEQVRTNQGYRVQFNGVLGPYKGGV